MKKLYKQAVSLLLVFILGISLCAGIAAFAANETRVDVGDLLAEIASKNLQAEDYSEFAWVRFFFTYDQIGSYYGDSTISDSDLRWAGWYEDLLADYDSLVYITDLKNRIEEYADLVESDWTSASWAAYSLVLDEAKDFLELAKDQIKEITAFPFPPHLTQKHIDDILEALEAAFADLEEEVVATVTVTFVNSDTTKGALTGALTFTGVPGASTPAIVEPGKSPEFGYQFEGWFDSYGMDVTLPTVYPSADMTITGYWEKKLDEWVTVTFVSEDVNKGTIDGADGNVLPMDGIIGKPLTPPGKTAKLGYEFDKWDPDVPATFPATDETYTATWKVKASDWVTITFVNGDTTKGSLTGPLTFTGIKGASTPAIVEPGKNPILGYDFDVWDKPVPTVYPDADVTITGSWKVKASDWVTITFVNGDTTKGSLTGTLSFTGIKGASTPAIVEPGKNPILGYEFDVWDKPVPTVYPDADVTITGSWKAIVSAIDWDAYHDAVNGWYDLQDYLNVDDIHTPESIEAARNLLNTHPDIQAHGQAVVASYSPWSGQKWLNEDGVYTQAEIDEWTDKLNNVLDEARALLKLKTPPPAIDWDAYHDAVNGWYDLQDYLDVDDIHTPESIEAARNLLNTHPDIQAHGQAVVASYSPWSGQKWLNEDGVYTQAEIDEWTDKLNNVLDEARALLKLKTPQYEEEDLYWKYLNSGLQAQWLKTSLYVNGLYTGAVQAFYEGICAEHGVYAAGPYVYRMGEFVKWEGDAQLDTAQYDNWKYYTDQNKIAIAMMIDVMMTSQPSFFPDFYFDLFLKWSKPLENYNWSTYIGLLESLFALQ